MDHMDDIDPVYGAVGRGYVVSAHGIQSCITRYINEARHPMKPNCEPMEIEPSEGDRYSHILIITSRGVSSGEELLVSYNKDLASREA
eukprot:40835-Eustigmatos_ZCMA.PRE.1